MLKNWASSDVILTGLRIKDFSSLRWNMYLVVARGKRIMPNLTYILGLSSRLLLEVIRRLGRKKTKQTSSPMNCNCVNCQRNVRGKKLGRYQGTQGLLCASKLSPWHKGHLPSAHWIRALTWGLKALFLNPVFAVYQLWDTGA